MLNYLLSFILAFVGVLPGVCFAEPHAYVKNGVEYVWEKEPCFKESKAVFVDAFSTCYASVPLEVLKKSSRDEVTLWLEETFDELYADLQTKEHYLWLTAKVEGKTAGFLVLDVSKFPEEICLAQFAVDPSLQRRGIGCAMVQSLFEQFSLCKKFVVITRRANEVAKNFYISLGFSPSSYMHEGYSSELYTGFEYELHQ